MRHVISTGTGYFLSAAMLRTVGRDAWARCVDRLVCHNADVRIATCVFNAGYALGALNHHFGNRVMTNEVTHRGTM